MYKFNFRLIITFATFFVTIASAQQVPTAAKTAAKKFIQAKFKKDKKAILSALDKTVTVLPSHELLKKRYGIAPGRDMNLTLQIESKKFTDVTIQLFTRDATAKKGQRKSIAETYVMDKGKWSYFLAEGPKMKYPFHRGFGAETRILDTEKGDVVLLVTDWHAQTDGNDDHVLIVLRKIKGKWKVIMDCVNW